MKLVILESPYAGDIDANIAYAKKCVKDCLSRNESPIVSHLLFTQPDILDDNKPKDRELGIKAGHAWIEACDYMVVYTDNGVSKGMLMGMDVAQGFNCPIVFRTLA